MVISIKEARKLLGKEARSLDDNEILEVIKFLSILAQEYLKKKSVKKSNNRLG